MKKSKIKTFPFEKGRRLTKKEVLMAHKAIEKKLKKKRPLRGRPLKLKNEKYQSISIRIHPKAISYVKKEAKARKMGYQSVINEILLKQTKARASKI